MRSFRRWPRGLLTKSSLLPISRKQFSSGGQTIGECESATLGLTLLSAETGQAPSLLHILWRPAIRPGIVGGYEVHTLRPGRMIEEPYFVKGTGIGIGQIHLATFFEIVSGDLIGIGNDSVYHFEAVAVGLMLKMAADGVESGRGKECQHRYQQEQGWQRGPILQR